MKKIITLLSISMVTFSYATAIRPDVGITVFPGNDDLSVGPVAIGFEINVFGTNYSNLFVNNNGNVTFNQSLTSYTPTGIATGTTTMFAPFFADVDTRGDSGGTVTYGATTVGSRAAFSVTWNDVRHYQQQTNLTNTFQLILIERFDTGAGNYDLEFNYSKIQWETGSASGGTNGLGGNSARVGFSAGNPSQANTFFEFANSGVNGSFLDSNTSTGLIYGRLNSTQNGRYVFNGRSGQVGDTVPEPSTGILLVSCALGLFAYRRR